MRESVRGSKTILIVPSHNPLHPASIISVIIMHSHIYIGNFPLMIPLFRHLFNNSKRGLEAEKLVKIALELVQARKASGQRVSVCKSFNNKN